MVISKMLWSGGALASALVAGGIVVMIGSDQSSPPSLIKDSGFDQVMPPGNYYGPGTFNTVETLADDSLVLHPACNIAKEDIDSRLRVGASVERSFKSVVESRFNASLGAMALPSLASTAVEASAGRAVYVQLKDVNFVHMTHQSLYELQEKYLTGACEEAIFHNLRAGARVCQTIAVLRADLVYRVSEEQALSTEQRAQIKAAVEAELEIRGGHGLSEEVLGDNLYFGVRLEQRCIKLPDQSEMEQTVARAP